MPLVGPGSWWGERQAYLEKQERKRKESHIWGRERVCDRCHCVTGLLSVFSPDFADVAQKYWTSS